MQTWLIRGVATLALLNLVAMVSLVVAYAWRHGLKPKLERRRIRRDQFERLLTQSRLDNLSTVD